MKHLLSLPHNGGVSGEFYHRAGLFGGLSVGGPDQRPLRDAEKVAELKRGEKNSA